MHRIYSIWQNIKRVLYKELLIEFRTRYAWSSLVMFALTTLACISMAIGGNVLSPLLDAILFWIIVFFSAMAGLGRVFIHEQEVGTMNTLRIYADPQTVLFGKLIYNIVLLIALILLVLPCYVIFLDIEIFWLWYLFLILLFGSIGIAAVSTLIAAIVANTESKGNLFTILTFPIILPLLLMVIKLTERTLINEPFMDVQQLCIVAAYDFIIVGVLSILFDYLWDE